ncbi:RNA-binding protein [Pyrus ussuriensis x Pyrus communis]|uniref:RNA-binding protein n=1 Tax=Pyrus ussuriensis x Pyrus communis TaxID=2448454 RepID=A0A5N5H9X7_9ROSA|nr:RNA-binding protein [Pyrus ussuriensis x Pyrus communis]
MKRLASEELVHDWDNKRLNVGRTVGQQQSYPGFERVPMPFTQQAMTPALLGKGAKQWRNGDWMCTNCNNHNYASRLNCNRCKTERDATAQPVNAM